VAFPSFGHRQVAYAKKSVSNSRPMDVNSSSLVLLLVILADSKDENKDLKSKFYLKVVVVSRNVGLNNVVFGSCLAMLRGAAKLGGFCCLDSRERLARSLCLYSLFLNLMF